MFPASSAAARNSSNNNKKKSKVEKKRRSKTLNFHCAMIVMDVLQNFLAVVLYSLLFIYGKVYGKLNLVCLIDTVFLTLAWTA